MMTKEWKCIESKFVSQVHATILVFVKRKETAHGRRETCGKIRMTLEGDRTGTFYIGSMYAIGYE